MSEPEPLGATLSPEENQFFETRGNSTIPGGDTHAGPGEAALSGDGANAGDGRPGETAKDGQTKVEKMVSLSALHEERGRRKSTESEKRALENQLAELRGKFIDQSVRLLSARLQKSPRPPGAAPPTNSMPSPAASRPTRAWPFTRCGRKVCLMPISQRSSTIPKR